MSFSLLNRTVSLRRNNPLTVSGKEEDVHVEPQNHCEDPGSRRLLNLKGDDYYASSTNVTPILQDKKG